MADNSIDLLYRNVFGTDTGKKVLADIFNFAGIDDSAVDFNNVNGTFFLQGQRNVAIYIRNKIKEKIKEKQEKVTDEE